MKNNKNTSKKPKYGFHQYYKNMFFTQSEISTILLAAFIQYKNESRRIDDLDILDFLEINDAPDYESIDDKFEILSDNRRKLLIRRVNKVLKLKDLYNDGIKIDDEGKRYIDSNFEAIIEKYFGYFLVKNVSCVA